MVTASSSAFLAPVRLLCGSCAAWPRTRGPFLYLLLFTVRLRDPVPCARDVFEHHPVLSLCRRHRQRTTFAGLLQAQLLRQARTGFGHVPCQAELLGTANHLSRHQRGVTLFARLLSARRFARQSLSPQLGGKDAYGFLFCVILIQRLWGVFSLAEKTLGALLLCGSHAR